VFQRGAKRLEFVDIALGRGNVAAAGRSHGACKIGDGLGLWKLAAPWLKRGCFLPRLAFERKARRHRRKPGIAVDGFKPEFLYGVAVVAELLRRSLLSHLQQGVFDEVQQVRLAWRCRPRPEPGRLL